MTDAKEEKTPCPGSSVPGQRCNGSDGTTREVTGPDAGVSGTGGNRQENTGDGTTKKEQKKGSPAPHYAERRTGLRGLGIAPVKGKKSTLRRQTEQDLFSPDPEVPYTRFENAARGLVCSLMERQDRMNEEIFLKIIDLGYRQDDLEAVVENLRQKGRSG